MPKPDNALTHAVMAINASSTYYPALQPELHELGTPCSVLVVRGLDLSTTEATVRI